MKERGRARQELQGAFGELWLRQPVKGLSLTKRCSPCPVPRSRASFPCLVLVLVLVLVPRARARARSPFPVPRASFLVPRTSCPASKFDSSPCVSRGEHGMRGVPNRSDFRFDPASGAPALRFVPVVAGLPRLRCSGPFVVQKPLPRLREKPAPGRLGQVFRTAGFMFFRIVQTPD